MKKLLILFCMVLVLCSFVSSSQSTTKAWAFQIVDATYPKSLGVVSNFRIHLNDGVEQMINFENSYDYQVEHYSVESQYYTYPVEYALPYSLFSCKIYCDSSRNNDGYLSVFSPDSEDYPNPYSSTNYYIDAINCKYDDWLIGKNVTQSVKCFLVPNQLYTEGIYSLNYGAYDFDVIKDDFNLFDNENIMNGCGNYLWGTNYDVCSNIVEFKFSVTFPIREEGTPYDHTIYPVSIEDLEDFNESSPPPVDDSSIGSESEGDNTNKLVSYNDLASVVRKKNATFLNLLFIEQLMFSIILILFYIFELVVTIYVFTSWIPGIFRAVINIIRKFGEL